MSETGIYRTPGSLTSLFSVITLDNSGARQLSFVYLGGHGLAH